MLLKEIKRTLPIFEKYYEEEERFEFDGDVCFFGFCTHAEKMSKEELKLLKDCGWVESEDYWIHY